MVFIVCLSKDAYLCGKQWVNMEIAIERERASFRLRKDLLRRLKERASGKHTTLEQFVEEVLMEAAFYTPNKETTAALEEARSGRYAGKLDVSTYEAFMKSVEDIE